MTADDEFGELTEIIVGALRAGSPETIDDTTLDAYVDAFRAELAARGKPPTEKVAEPVRSRRRKADAAQPDLFGGFGRR